MGLIRKTLSISTLGLVSWRSKKEKLREANDLLDLTRADLDQATEKHALARERLTDSRTRAPSGPNSTASATPGRPGGPGAARSRSKIGRGRVALGAVRDAVEPVVRSANEARERVRRPRTGGGRRRVGAKRGGPSEPSQRPEKQGRPLRPLSRRAGEEGEGSIAPGSWSDRRCRRPSGTGRRHRSGPRPPADVGVGTQNEEGGVSYR